MRKLSRNEVEEFLEASIWRHHKKRQSQVGRTSCLVPRNRGALYHDLRRDELWGSFFTAAPQGLRRSVEQIQNSQASLKELSARYGINLKTVAKWRRRSSVCDARIGAEGASFTPTGRNLRQGKGSGQSIWRFFYFSVGLRCAVR